MLAFWKQTSQGSSRLKQSSLGITSLVYKIRKAVTTEKSMWMCEKNLTHLDEIYQMPFLSATDKHV